MVSISVILEWLTIIERKNSMQLKLFALNRCVYFVEYVRFCVKYCTICRVYRSS